jgi:mRNA-degrading endonuclease RelE of RelBE toxin-antitoxin system
VDSVVKGLFFETIGFTSRLAHYLNDDEYRQLQLALLANPERGAVMSGTGGFRKLRWGNSRRGKGKRGGLRIVYYWLEQASHFWMFAIYDKDEAGNLTKAQQHALKQTINEELNQRGVL